MPRVAVRPGRGRPTVVLMRVATVAAAATAVLLTACAVGSTGSDSQPKPRPSARGVPSAVTVRAGDTVGAKVIVLNPTGRPLRKKGCGVLFQVALTTSRTSPKHPVSGVGSLLCLQTLTVPVGRSEYRADFYVGHGSCSRNKPSHPRQVQCLPSGLPPPLPPGTYWLWLYQNPEDRSPLPTPTPTRIRVVQAA